MEQTGKCLCGAVTFQARDVDPDAHACHCDMCRRWSGGPGMTARVGSITFNDDAPVTRFQSSDWAVRAFCNRCGSNLYYHFLPNDLYVVWLGTFDDQSQFQLSEEIYVNEKPASYHFAGDHPRLTEEQFLARMQAEMNNQGP